MKDFIRAAAFCLLSAGAATAQVPGIDLIITPKLGGHFAAGNLTESATGVATKIAPGLAMGASVELDLAPLPVGLRANVDLASDGDLELDGSATGSKADQVNIVGDLIIRPLSRLLMVQPYLVIGGGVKRTTLSNDQIGFAETQSNPTAHLGAGVVLNLGGLKLSAEISDYLSSYEGPGERKQGQHDIFTMIGVRIGLL